MYTLRFGSSIIFAGIVTVALFYLMQALIAGGRSPMTRNEAIQLVNFVRIKQPMRVETKELEPKKPPPPDQPPPPMRQTFNHVSVAKVGYRMSTPDLKVNSTVKGGDFNISDSDYLPLVKVQPIYPERAVTHGFSGWVIVKFTVTPSGTVANPAVVKDCAWIQPPGYQGGNCHDSPNPIFDSASIRAALKFKYKPRIIDGKPIQTEGVENKITFDLSGADATG